MRRAPLGLLALGAMCLTSSALVGCGATPTLFPSPPPTATRPPQADLELPAPVTFLRQGQVWSLARDGQTQGQITHEAAAVESLDVSPADGGLVYVSGNSLIYSDALGRQRRVLLAGPALPPPADELAGLNDRARILGRIAAPTWSPDGKRIAYVQNGLNLLTVSSGEVETVHPNDVIPEGGEAADRLVIASVISWAPDGQHLLVTTYRYPLGSIYAQKVALKTLAGYLISVGDGLDWTSAWGADSQSFYLANSTLGRSEALSRCTVAEGRCSSLGQYVPARTSFYYAYPHAVGPDKAAVFMATGPDGGEPPSAFGLYRVGPNGGGTTELRRDQYAVQTALWSRDGRGALIVTGAASAGVPAETLVWLPADGGPAVPLPVSGASCLRWGAE